MNTSESLDLASFDVSEITVQEASDTTGGYGPAASIAWCLGYFTAVLQATETQLEGCGMTLGDGA